MKKWKMGWWFQTSSELCPNKTRTLTTEISPESRDSADHKRTPHTSGPNSKGRNDDYPTREPRESRNPKIGYFT